MEDSKIPDDRDGEIDARRPPLPISQLDLHSIHDVVSDHCFSRSAANSVGDRHGDVGDSKQGANARAGSITVDKLTDNSGPRPVG